MGKAIEAIVSDPEKHRELSETGHAEVRKHYAWAAHVASYLDEVLKVIPTEPVVRGSKSRGSLVERERWIVMDLLPRIEDEPGELVEKWRQIFTEQPIGFGIATGLSFDEAWEVIRRCGMPEPGFVISGLGAEIRYGESGVLDERWQNQIGTRWNRSAVIDALAEVGGLSMQDESFQHQFKVSYLMDSNNASSRLALQRILREKGVSAKVIVTAKAFRRCHPDPQRQGRGPPLPGEPMGDRSRTDLLLRHLRKRHICRPRQEPFRTRGRCGSHLAPAPLTATAVSRRGKGSHRIFRRPWSTTNSSKAASRPSPMRTR